MIEVTNQFVSYNHFMSEWLNNDYLIVIDTSNLNLSLELQEK